MIRLCTLAVALSVGLTALQATAQIAEAPAPVAGGMQDISTNEYRQHLLSLTALVDHCAKERTEDTCNPRSVGYDDRVQFNIGGGQVRREIRYDWLRSLMAKAAQKDKDESPATKAKGKEKPDAEDSDDSTEEDNLLKALPTPLTTAQLLKAAQDRLTHDIAQIDGTAVPQNTHNQEHAILKDVLAGRAYRNLGEPTAKDSARDKFSNWVNELLMRLVGLGERSAWIGRLLSWGFILLVGAGILWGLLQIERKWRMNLIPPMEGPPAGAASARDWQLWLEDARKAAAEGLWRDAIHFLYWASISRLESWRLWPVDRARTPREYLALIAPDDPRRQGLFTLTRSFERTWYGGYAVNENDYKQAKQIVDALISKTAMPGGDAS